MEVRLHSISVFYQMKFGNSMNVVLFFTLSPLGSKELKITNKQTNKNLYLLRRQSHRLQTVSWIVHS